MRFLSRLKTPARHAGRTGLSFPNESRSYDATRRAVHFWGHDSAMEASFYVTADALMRLQPGSSIDEAGCLSAFDQNRALIRTVAAKVYARGNRGCYDLTVSDLPDSAR